MSKLKFNVTIADLRALEPCYDPATKLGENWSGTLIDILDCRGAKDADKIWALSRLLDNKTARLFAVWCAREAVKLSTNVDPRSLAAIDVAEKFANGQATEEELSAAESAAESAARSAAWSAAESAAESAAWSAARSAAWSAAESAAESAAWSAARSAARSAQVTQLRKMVLSLIAPTQINKVKLEERTSEQLLKIIRANKEAKKILIERIEREDV